MRMRKKKHGAERMAACDSYFIHSSEDLPPMPIELEIGCGKGSFICQSAERNPNQRYIAMEKMSDIILLAAEKAQKMGLTNVLFWRENAVKIAEMFPEHSVSCIYLNFSDPWPKKGYQKRRLTYRDFLEIYRRVLTEDGKIILKTDNAELFDFSLEEFTACGFTLSEICRDLHNSRYAADNIMTEYEMNFSSKGFPIHRVVASV